MSGSIPFHLREQSYERKTCVHCQKVIPKSSICYMGKEDIWIYYHGNCWESRKNKKHVPLTSQKAPATVRQRTNPSPSPLMESQAKKQASNLVKKTPPASAFMKNMPLHQTDSPLSMNFPSLINGPLEEQSQMSPFQLPTSSARPQQQVLTRKSGTSHDTSPQAPFHQANSSLTSNTITSSSSSTVSAPTMKFSDTQTSMVPPDPTGLNPLGQEWFKNLASVIKSFNSHDTRHLLPKQKEITRPRFTNLKSYLKLYRDAIPLHLRKYILKPLYKMEKEFENPNYPDKCLSCQSVIRKKELCVGYHFYNFVRADIYRETRLFTDCIPNAPKYCFMARNTVRNYF
jgi:hypothetical protein